MVGGSLLGAFFWLWRGFWVGTRVGPWEFPLRLKDRGDIGRPEPRRPRFDDHAEVARCDKYLRLWMLPEQFERRADEAVVRDSKVQPVRCRLHLRLIRARHQRN